MKHSLSLTLIGLVFLFTSCATIFSGTRQKVTINSDQKGASVYVANFDKMSSSYLKNGSWRKLENVSSIEIGKTPLTTKVERKTNLIFIKKEGYADTLIYCALPKVRITTIDANTGKTIKQNIVPAKYHVRTNALVWGNIILGGLVGIIVDGVTGAINRLDKNMDVNLKSKPLVSQ